MADLDVEKFMEGLNLENPESDDPVRIMQDQGQIQEYIRKLQEQMARTAEVSAPGMSIPPIIFIIAFILFFSTIGKLGDPQLVIKVESVSIFPKIILSGW